MNLSPLAVQKFFDNNGRPLVGGLLFTYIAGTTTKLATYLDQAGTPNTNPVVLDYRGEANVWLNQELTYKFVLAPADDTDPPTRPIWSVDNISSAITFESLTAQIIGQKLWPRTAAETAGGVTIVDFGYPPGDIRRYGAIGDNASECATAIADAFAQAEADGAKVIIPDGTFRFSSALTINASIAVEGYGELASVLMKNGNFDGITVNAGSPSFVGFTLDSAGGADASSGIVSNQTGRTSCDRITVQNQGKHGIEILKCNIGNFTNILVLFNGGDGINISGTAPVPDTNAITFINIDARGNTGWGFNVDVGWANFVFGVVTQSNVAGGVRLNNCRQSFFQIYSESNTGPDIELVNTTDCQGNTIFVGEGEVTFGGTTSERNMVLHGKRQAVHDPCFNKVTSDKFILPNERQDGTDYTGILTFEHTANNIFTMTLSASAADQVLRILNSDGSFKSRIDCGAYLANKAASNSGSGAVMYGGTVRTTVGAAGGASALPATPAGYVIINVAGTERQIPFYPVP